MLTTTRLTPRPVTRIAVLALACLAGCGRDGPTQAAPQPLPPAPSSSDTAPAVMIFTEVAAESGVTLVNVNGNAAEKATILESLGQGAAVLDYDNDGDLDLFVLNGDAVNGVPADVNPTSAFYRHETPFRFKDVTVDVGLRLRGMFQGAYAADYDGDGWTDLFLTAHGSSRLFRNKGDGTFEDVTAKTGTGIPGWTTGAAFFDADADGDLDLFVARYVEFDVAKPPNRGKPCDYRGLKAACGPHGLVPETDFFLENVGGTFVEATAKAGFDQAQPAYGLGVVVFDFDRDGDPDVYVANDSVANNLWENKGGGKFVEVAPALGCDLGEGGRPQASMGIDAADVDQDGRSDVFITNFEHDTNTLYLNWVDRKVRGFFDASGSCGLGPPSFPQLGWGTRIVDFDRDGWPDIVVANGHIYPQVDTANLDTSYRQRNQLYRNLGVDAKKQVRFDEVRPAGGFFERRGLGRGLLVADFDDDGDQDIFIVNMDGPPSLGRNDSKSTGNWVGVHVEGSGRNRDAVGTVLTVTDSQGAVHRVERTYGAGFYSTSDPRLWTALGAATIRSASLRWPNGKTLDLPTSILNRYVRVSEAAGTVEPWQGR